MHDFDIYFSGQLLPDADPALARAGVAKLFKLEGKALDKLFAGNAVRIARSVDVEKANRYRKAFRKFGALIDVVPHHAEAPEKPGRTTAPVSVTDSESESGLVLLPPQTGTLEDCAPIVDAQHIGDISGLSLADPGSELVTAPPVTTVEYDTSAFSLGPANSGSLEDCNRAAEPTAMPNIDHLEIVARKD